MKLELKRNLILKNLGIVLWKLRYPIILTDKVPIILLANLRLLMVSDLPVSLKDSFIIDVIQSMNINQAEVQMITIDLINNIILPSSINVLRYCWWIGTKVLRDFQCVNLVTPSLIILKCSSKYKRDLWSQISKFVYCNRL